MADMPYKCVSMSMMWTLLWLMHHGYRDKCDFVSSMTERRCQADLQGETETAIDLEWCSVSAKSATKWIGKLRFAVTSDGEQKETFKSKLLTMPTSEAIFLLTTFSRMAASVSSDQKSFVQTISKEIYEVCFVARHLKQENKRTDDDDDDKIIQLFLEHFLE